MSLTVVTSGSQLMDGSEDSLISETTAAVYILSLDLTPMALGDVIEVRIYTKTKSASTKEIAYIATYSNVQGEPNKFSVPVPAGYYFEATLKQTAGTNRTIDWALLSA